MELRAGKGLVPNTKNSTIEARRRESVRGYGEAGSHPELKRVYKSPDHGVRTLLGNRGPQGTGPRHMGEGFKLRPCTA